MPKYASKGKFPLCRRHAKGVESTRRTVRLSQKRLTHPSPVASISTVLKTGCGTGRRRSEGEASGVGVVLVGVGEPLVEESGGFAFVAG